jgi:predicted nuclease of predicted toxin-antitoxin system
VIVKLILDENISPRVAKTLKTENGVDVCHIRDRGLLGATDHEVLNRAFGEDRILVTANVKDFRKLARARELHAGIIFIEDGNLCYEEQLIIVRRAITVLRRQPDMVNRALFISINGNITFKVIPR